MKAKIFITITVFMAAVTFVLAHGGEDHDKKKKNSMTNDTVEKVQQTPAQHEHSQESRHQHGEKQAHQEHVYGKEKIKADLDDFPTLHPLIVHFPIVLLLLAFFAQGAGLFVFKCELSWVTLLLLIGGFIGAYIAGEYVHPHTNGLTDNAAKVLEEHETYAGYTLWLSAIAVLFKIASRFLLKGKLWIEIVVAVVLAASAFCVSMAGHYGAQLTHLEGVGPQGKFLETNEHEHQH